MKMLIKVVVVLVIYWPYKVLYSEVDNFWIDFLVIFVAFAVANGITYLMDKKGAAKPGGDASDDKKS